jgi:hypothetical protein
MAFEKVAGRRVLAVAGTGLTMGGIPGVARLHPSPNHAVATRCLHTTVQTGVIIVRVAVVAFLVPLHNAVPTNGVRWLAAIMIRFWTRARRKKKYAYEQDGYP